MIIETIEDYYKHKMLIPVCEESVQLDKHINEYKKMKRRKRVINRKNENELSRAIEVIQFKMSLLKKVLKRRNLWG